MLLILQSSFHYNSTKLLNNNNNKNNNSNCSFPAHVNLNPPRNEKKKLIVGNAGGEDPPQSGVAVEEKKTPPPPPPPSQIEASQGYPTPLGATRRDGGINFSISSTNSSSAILCLFNSPSDLYKVCMSICMSLYIHFSSTLKSIIIHSEDSESADLLGSTYQ